MSLSFCPFIRQQLPGLTEVHAQLLKALTVVGNFTDRFNITDYYGHDLMKSTLLLSMNNSYPYYELQNSYPLA
jgi:hypothetical protein